MFTSSYLMKSKYRVQSCIFDFLLSGLGGSQVKYQEEEAKEEEEEEKEKDEAQKKKKIKKEKKK